MPHVESEIEEEKLWDREQALARLLNKEVLLNKICEVFVFKAPIKVLPATKYRDSCNRQVKRLVTGY